MSLLVRRLPRQKDVQMSDNTMKVLLAGIAGATLVGLAAVHPYLAALALGICLLLAPIELMK